MTIQVFAAIDGEISAIDPYLTISDGLLFKENEFPAIHIEKRTKEGYAGEILTEG